MKKLILAMCLAMCTISTYAYEVKPNDDLVTQKVINYQIDGKNYTPIEFDKLVKEQPTIASKPCTITIVVQGSINGIRFRFTEEVTFEASGFWCFMAKVAAYLAEVFT